MTPGGLIFLAIVVLWAVYLVPVWAGERARVASEQQARRDAEALVTEDHSQPRVVLTAGRPALSTAARIGALAAAQRALVEQRRGMRRRRLLRTTGLVVGVLAVVGALVAAATVAAPWWTIGVGVGWIVIGAAAGVLGARNDRRRLSAARSRLRLAHTLQPELPANARPVQLFDHGREPVHRAPVLTPAVPGATWTPVVIPRPTYTMAARVTHAPPLPWVDLTPEPLPAPAALAEIPQPHPEANPEYRRSASA